MARLPTGMTAGRPGFPLGGAITRNDLEGDPHPLLAQLRAHEPVSWLPALGGWLVTRRDLALRVMRDAAAFTVDDPRFSTARVVGPSMLSLDGSEHTRHRAPFVPGFTRPAVNAELGAFVEAQAQALVDRLRPKGATDLRRTLAGPLAVAVVAEALGFGDTDPGMVLSWYHGIVGAVSALTGQPGGDAHPEPKAPQSAQEPGQSAQEPGEEPGQSAQEPGRNVAPSGQVAIQVAAGEAAFSSLSARLRDVIANGHGSLLAQAAGTGGLAPGEVISNAAVLMFGGIETTEGMIANALLHLLSHPGQFALVKSDHSLLPNAVEESLRLEPAAAFVDRYATTGVRIGGADVARGDLVSVSLAGAGRDPATFAHPNDFDVRRPNARLHLAFAHGPHFCLGAHLARLEAVAAVRAAMTLPGLRQAPGAPSAPRGLVFRKPPDLLVRWDR